MLVIWCEVKFLAPFFVMSPDIVNSLVTGGANLLGGITNYLFGESAANNQLKRQKDLFDYQSQYNLPSAQFERLRDAGLTPAAAAQSIAGQQTSQSMPTVSPRPVFQQNGFDNLGNSIMDAKLKTSEIMGNNAQTSNTIAFGLHIEPLYKAKVDNIIQDTEMKKSQVGLNGRLGFYYKQVANQIREQRPWQLATLVAGLSNLSAMVEERIAHKNLMEQEKETSAAQEGLFRQETSTQKALEGLYTEETETERHKQRELDSETERNYSEKFNLDQTGFGLMFDNQIRSMGWNPSTSANENLKRLVFTEPKSAYAVLNNLTKTAQLADSWMQGQFGENYKKKLKRLAAAGFIHYAGNKLIDTQLRRFGSFTGSIGNLIPLAHPNQPNRVKGFSLY